MTIKVGINGFGRIGRMVFRAAARDFADIEIELPCGAVIRVPDEEPVLRRVLALLLEAEPTAAGPGDNLARVHHQASAGGRLR